MPLKKLYEEGPKRSCPYCGHYPTKYHHGQEYCGKCGIITRLGEAFLGSKK